MKRPFKYFLIVFALGVGWSMAAGAPVFAAEKNPVKITIKPGRYASVKGDVDKFRAIKWMKDGYVGGISSLSFEDKLNGGTLSFEGHSILEENDNGAKLLFQKGDDFFIQSEYQSFRKYYDNSGGVYQPFRTLKTNDLTRQDLRMDMGKFELQAGLGDIKDPDIVLTYQQLNKKGLKSMLDWGSVKEVATKKTAPTWKSLDQTIDVIALKGKKEVAGVLVKGEQKAQFERSHEYKEQKQLATTSTASDKALRSQDERPEATIYSSALRGEKWLLNDKAFVGLGYRYSHIKSADNRLLQELTPSYQLFNYSTSGKTSLPSPSEASEDTHSWVGNFNANLTSDLSFISKMRVEHKAKKGGSTYPTDTTAGIPDGIANKTDFSSIEQKVSRVGENLSLRYSGIARTSLYAELEMEQAENWMTKMLTSLGGQTSASSPFYEENLNNTQKTSWTLGGRVIPSKFLNITTQVRQRFQKNDYDNVDSFGSPVTVLDGMDINSDEMSAKVAWKPYRWVQSSFRYQFHNTKFYPRAEGFGEAKNQMLNHIYTYDVSLQPADTWLFLLSYSMEQPTTKTIAASAANVTAQKSIPEFNSWVNSCLFSASYAPKENLSLTNTVYYAWADNMDTYDKALPGIPMTAAYKQLDLTTALQWSPKKDLTISPSYEYASYDGNPLVDTANYSAHIFQVDVGLKW